MPFTPPSFVEIRDGILRDIRSQLPDAAIGSDSDNFIRSAAVAAAIEGLYQHQSWIFRQVFPDTADEAELLHHASQRGVVQKAAVAARGVATLTGTAGAALLTGASLKHKATGTLLTATASATIGSGGSVTVAVAAATAGAAANGLSGPCTLISPPTGMDATATLSTAMAGGTDLEKPEAVLARLLELLRNPPAGGSPADYRRWALEVPGVANAIVLPKRRGVATVDVCITAADGLPSAAVIAACASWIEDRRPATAEVFVYAPVVRTVDMRAKVELLTGFTLAGVQAATATAYTEALASLSPNEALRRWRIETLLGNIAGVADRLLVTPAANVAASDDALLIGWIRPGTVTLEAMA